MVTYDITSDFEKNAFNNFFLGTNSCKTTLYYIISLFSYLSGFLSFWKIRIPPSHTKTSHANHHRPGWSSWSIQLLICWFTVEHRAFIHQHWKFLVSCCVILCLNIFFKFYLLLHIVRSVTQFLTSVIQRLDDFFVSVYSVYAKCIAGPASGIRLACKPISVGSEVSLQYKLSQTTCDAIWDVAWSICC